MRNLDSLEKAIDIFESIPDNFINNYHILLAWTIASLASIGSLFYSEISGFVPCTYCWYERIAMYPLVIILGVGLIIKNNQSWLFGLPLSVIGLLITIYHYQLQIHHQLT